MTPIRVEVVDGGFLVRVASKPRLTLDQKLKAFDPKSHGGEVMASVLVGAERVTCGTTGEPVGSSLSPSALVPAREKTPDSLRKLKMRVLVASTNGALQAHIQAIVRDNRQ